MNTPAHVFTPGLVHPPQGVSTGDVPPAGERGELEEYARFESGELAAPGVSPAFARARGQSRPEVIMVLGDLAVLVGMYALLVVGFDTVTTDTPHLALWCLGLVAAWLLVGSRLAYGRDVLAHRLQSAYVAAKATLISGGIFYLLPLIGGGGHSRINNITVVLALASAMATWRLVLARILPVPVQELVIVGAGWAGQALADALAGRQVRHLRVVAFVDADPMFIGRSILGAPVHPIMDLSRLVRRPTGMARVVLANANHAHAAIFEQLTDLAHSGIEVIQMSTLYEQVTGCIPVHHLGTYWWALVPRPSSDTLYWYGKRVFDIVSALMGLAVLGVLLPVLWPVLRYQTGGGPVFKQIRVGRYGRRFVLYKLRTLPLTSDSHSDWRGRKAANKPTRLCAFIRDTGLDELPQLFNVLRGEMSLVGPRPYVPEEVEDLMHQIPFYRSRAMVQPGVTGWAQINYGYGLSLEDEVEKLQLDLYYIGHQSTYLDLLIVLRTIANMARGRRPASRVSLSASPRGALHISSKSQDVPGTLVAPGQAN